MAILLLGYTNAERWTLTIQGDLEKCLIKFTPKHSTKIKGKSKPLSRVNYSFFSACSKIYRITHNIFSNDILSTTYKCIPFGASGFFTHSRAVVVVALHLPRGDFPERYRGPVQFCRLVKLREELLTSYTGTS